MFENTRSGKEGLAMRLRTCSNIHDGDRLRQKPDLNPDPHVLARRIAQRFELIAAGLAGRDEVIV